MNPFVLKSSIFLAIISIQLSCAQRKDKYYTITGTVTSTSQYCGGARPSDEHLAELSKPYPMSDKVLYVKSGTFNSENSKVIIDFKTDSAGGFQVKLKKGNYCLVEEYKSKELVVPKNDKYSTWDEKCLRDEYGKCDYLLNVADKNITNIKLNYYKPCNWSRPCLQYDGPLPPSAPRNQK